MEKTFTSYFKDNPMTIIWTKKAYSDIWFQPPGLRGGSCLATFTNSRKKDLKF